MATNSYVPFLSSVYRGILSDASELIPALAKDCDRDLSRLLSLLKTRGHHFAMVDLPAFGKHFDKCLSRGHLLRSGVVGFRPFRRRGVIPLLFKGLLLRVFEVDGSVKSDPDILAMKFLRQLFRVAKRFRVMCSQQVIEEHIHEFVKVDEECLSPSLDWDREDFNGVDALQHSFADRLLHPCADNTSAPPPHYELQFAHSIDRVCDIVVSTLGVYHPSAWDFRHGPGAVSDLPPRKKFKYEFLNWDARLERDYPFADFAFANFSMWADHVVGGVTLDSDPVSKLIPVPKTLDAPRLIASEPLSRQWCQQNLRDFFYNRVQCSWLSRSITFRDQTPNQELATSSSLSGSHATIDLSSASDRISCWLVERAFRKNPGVLSALQSVRTNHVRYEIGSCPYVKKLRKYSTMGSAVTFPLQSLVFLMLALSSLCYIRKIAPSKENLAKLAREVRVFGDDIVIPIDACDHLIGILHLYGLKVNPQKTFRTGKFRESCGREAYGGHDVSCAYVLGVPTYKRPESIISAVDTIKNLVDKGFFRTAEEIKRTLPGRMIFAPSAFGSGSFGLPEFMCTGKPPLRRRNPYTQVLEQRIHIPTVKSGRGIAEGNPMVLQYFTEACKARFVQGERLGPPLRAKISLSLRWVEV